jgi:hypothetical protein
MPYGGFYSFTSLRIKYDLTRTRRGEVSIKIFFKKTESKHSESYWTIKRDSDPWAKTSIKPRVPQAEPSDGQPGRGTQTNSFSE